MTTVVESSASEHQSRGAEWGGPWRLSCTRPPPKAGWEVNIVQSPLTANYERLEYWVYGWYGVSYRGMVIIGGCWVDNIETEGLHLQSGLQNHEFLNFLSEETLLSIV